MKWNTLRRNVINVVMGVFVAIVFGLTGCGGGGSTAVTQGTSAFTTADFAGKTVYYVSKGYYQAATFNLDGTAQSGTGSNSAGTWSVSNGTLTLVNTGTGEQLHYNMISNDTVNRYYKVQKDSTAGDTVTVGMFYDQATALDQAKNFVATHRLPEGGKCDGVDTSKTPDSIGLGMEEGKVVTNSTWGACVYSTDKNGVTTHN